MTKHKITSSFSKYHDMHVATCDLDGYLFTGRADTEARAIELCQLSLNKYLKEKNEKL